MLRLVGGSWEQWENELTFERLKVLSESALEMPPVYISAYAAAIALGAMKPPDKRGVASGSGVSSSKPGVLPNGFTEADPSFLGLFGSDGNIL